MRKLKFRVVSATCRRVLSHQFNLRVFPLWLGAWMSAPLVCHASLVASESFESYAPGALSSQTGGGTGWTGNWTAPGNVTRAEVVDTTSNPAGLSRPAGGAPINGATRALEVQLSGAATSQLAGVRTLASRFHRPSTSVTWCATRGSQLGLRQQHLHAASGHQCEQLLPR